MPDLGIKLSDDRTKALMKRLEGVYSEAYKTAIENEKIALKKFDALTDEALKDLTPEARKLKREAFAREVKRTKTLTNKIGAELANAGQTAAQIIQGEMTNLYNLNYDFTSYSVQQQAGLQLDFTIYDKNQIAALVQENQSPFSKIAYNNLGKDKIVTQRLQNQFIQAALNGEGQQKIIRRIRTVTGQSTRQAKRVAQTESTRVRNQGINMGIVEANDIGVATEKQWVAKMRNTRELHQLTHGEIVANGEKFSNDLEYPGDPSGKPWNVINCFCGVIAKVKSTSKALQASRNKFDKSMGFDEYYTRAAGNVIGAETELGYQKLRLANSERILKATDSKTAKENVRLATGAVSRAEKALAREKELHKLATRRAEREAKR